MHGCLLQDPSIDLAYAVAEASAYGFEHQEPGFPDSDSAANTSFAYLYASTLAFVGAEDWNIAGEIIGFVSWRMPLFTVVLCSERLDMHMRATEPACMASSACHDLAFSSSASVFLMHKPCARDGLPSWFDI